MNDRKQALLRGLERVRALIDGMPDTLSVDGMQLAVLKALEDVPVLELRAWLSSPVSTRFRKLVAQRELERRGEPLTSPPAPHEVVDE